jgi:hypothetical protein
MSHAFQIQKPVFDPKTGTLRFVCVVPKFGGFEEVVALPKDAPLPALPDAVRERLLALCAVLIGTSYFKAAPAEVLDVGFELTPAAKRVA